MSKLAKIIPRPDLLDMRRVTTHPGEMLQLEFLAPLHLSARVVAQDIGIPANRLTEIIAGRRGISADTALRLSRYFKTSAAFWMNLQAMYDLTHAIVENRAIYAKIGSRDAA